METVAVCVCGTDATSDCVRVVLLSLVVQACNGERGFSTNHIFRTGF